MVRHRMLVKLLVLVICTVIATVVVQSLFKSLLLESSLMRSKVLNNYMEEKLRDDRKYILFYTKYFNEHLWGMTKETYHEDFLESIKCPNTNCVFTNNKNLLENFHEYDAIVFHSASYMDWLGLDLPKTRSPHQVYIMATKESPGEIKRDLDLDNDFYNLTMSYRLDSDIDWFYGITTDLATSRRVAPGIDIDWKQPDENFSDENIMQLIKRKTKTAAWFVSHCNVFSRRDELAKKLQDNDIDVDIYGKCGNLTCKRLSSECDEMLNSTYRFYLAFENTLCIDYLTEKLYNTIKNFVVPVVYSGAEVSRFLPPKSYINAEDFDTAEDLARYLKYLTANPDEYIKYFWWKKHYNVSRYDDLEFCGICRKLNEPNFTAKRQVYRSIKDWFYRDTCRHPKIKF